MTIEIRVAAREDRDLATELLTKLLDPVTVSILMQLAEQSVFIIAYRGKDFPTAAAQLMVLDNDVCIVLAVAIHPDWVSTDIENALVEYVERICRKRRCREVVFLLREGDTPLIKLLEKRGYRERDIDARIAELAIALSRGVILSKTL